MMTRLRLQRSRRYSPVGIEAGANVHGMPQKMLAHWLHIIEVGETDLGSDLERRQKMPPIVRQLDTKMPLPNVPGLRDLLPDAVPILPWDMLSGDCEIVPQFPGDASERDVRRGEMGDVTHLSCSSRCVVRFAGTLFAQQHRSVFSNWFQEAARTLAFCLGRGKPYAATRLPCTPGVLALRIMGDASRLEMLLYMLRHHEISRHPPHSKCSDICAGLAE